MADDEDETEWRFELEDLDDPDDPDDPEAANGNTESAAGIERPPLEPESPSLENALFVVLGVLVMVFVFFQVASIAFLGG